MGEFSSINIDIKNGMYEVNGREVSETATYLELKFEDGEWSLVIEERNTYTTSVR